MVRLFGDPGHRKESGLGVLPSFMNGWRKSSTGQDRAAEKQNLQGGPQATAWEPTTNTF